MPLNDHFVYTPPQEPLQIVYEDADLVIINKPAGLLSVPGRLPEHHDSAYYRVLDQFPEAKITHRLDMATSGILMFAKHRDAEVAVSKMFQARTVTKHYQALVQGQIQQSGCVEVPLITTGKIVHDRLYILNWVKRQKPSLNLCNTMQRRISVVYYSPQLQGVHINYACICNILDIPLQGISYIILNLLTVRSNVWHSMPVISNLRNP